jgi:hypothetical protein
MDSIWVQFTAVVLMCLIVLAVASRDRAVAAITLSAVGIGCAVWGGLMAVREMSWTAVAALFAALVCGVVAMELRRGRR